MGSLGKKSRFQLWPKVGICFNLQLNSLETCELSAQFRCQWQVGGLPSYSRVVAGNDRPHHTSEDSFTQSHTVDEVPSHISKVLAARKPVYGQIRFPPPTTLISPPPDFRDSRLGNGPHTPKTHFQATNLQLCLPEPFCNQCERGNRLGLA